MSRKTIALFMWGYQHHFQIRIQNLARSALKELGVSIDANALLVGVRRAGSINPHPVCVQPENAMWPLSLFDKLHELIEEVYEGHESKNICYGDERSNREKPEMLRKDSTRTAVARVLLPFDREHHVRSFCGRPQLVGDFYVVPVLQIPETLFQKFPALDEVPAERQFSTGYRSIIDALLAKVLDEACKELQHPEPGRSMNGDMRRADEIVRIAASNFMHTLGIAISDNFEYADFFPRLNLISSLLYEGAQGVGRLLLAHPENPRIEYLIRFREPVPFDEPRWTRKVLQLAGTNAALVANNTHVFGLGRLKPSANSNDQSVFTVDFLDHYHWELKCGEIALLRSHYGVPTLPNEIFEKDVFTSNIARLFPTSTEHDQNHLWKLFIAATRQDMGSMIVITDNALSEAQRLSDQGTGIEPVKLTVEMLKQVSCIDGTILLDPHGTCHAIGVILDGAVNNECTPSRGSRYNSAVRYVRSSIVPMVAIIVSDDRTVDVFPALRPRVCGKRLTENLAAFTNATDDNYHAPMNWLDSHRFYLDNEQCTQINSSLERLKAAPLDMGEIRYLVRKFEAHPDFDQSYLRY